MVTPTAKFIARVLLVSLKTHSALFSHLNYLTATLKFYPTLNVIYVFTEQQAGLCPRAANKPFIKLCVPVDLRLESGAG